MWWFGAANKSTSAALLPLPPLPPCFRRFYRASAPPSFRRFHRSAPIISVMRPSTTRCRQDHRMPRADGSPAIDAIAVPRRRLHSPTPSDIVALLRRRNPSLSPAFVIRERCISRPPPSLTNDTGEAGGSVCMRSHVGRRREDPRKLPPAPASANDAVLACGRPSEVSISVIIGEHRGGGWRERPPEPSSSDATGEAGGRVHPSHHLRVLWGRPVEASNHVVIVERRG